MIIVSAIMLHGSDKFSIKLLEDLPENYTQAEVDEREIYWGLKLNTLSPFGYNLKLGNARGLVSKETRLKISKSNLGKKASEETRKRLSISHKGYKVSQSTKDKLSKVFRGVKPSENTRLGAKLKNSKTYTLVSPFNEIITITNMRTFCKENKLPCSSMSRLVTGKVLIYKNWKVHKTD